MVKHLQHWFKYVREKIIPSFAAFFTNDDVSYLRNTETARNAQFCGCLDNIYL